MNFDRQLLLGGLGPSTLCPFYITTVTWMDTQQIHHRASAESSYHQVEQLGLMELMHHPEPLCSSQLKTHTHTHTHTHTNGKFPAKERTLRTGQLGLLL